MAVTTVCDSDTHVLQHGCITAAACCTQTYTNTHSLAGLRLGMKLRARRALCGLTAKLHSDGTACALVDLFLMLVVLLLLLLLLLQLLPDLLLLVQLLSALLLQFTQSSPQAFWGNAWRTTSREPSQQGSCTVAVEQQAKVMHGITTV